MPLPGLRIREKKICISKKITWSCDQVLRFDNSKPNPTLKGPSPPPSRGPSKEIQTYDEDKSTTQDL